MAKEIDEFFHIGDKNCVRHINGAIIDDILNRTDEPHVVMGHVCKHREDNQRRTPYIHIIPDDALLDGC